MVAQRPPQKTRNTGLHFWAQFAAPDVEPAFTNVNKVGPKMLPAKRPWTRDLENSSGAFFLAALLAFFAAYSLQVDRRRRFVVYLFTYGLRHAGVMSRRSPDTTRSDVQSHLRRPGHHTWNNDTTILPRRFRL